MRRRGIMQRLKHAEITLRNMVEGSRAHKMKNRLSNLENTFSEMLTFQITTIIQMGRRSTQRKVRFLKLNDLI